MNKAFGMTRFAPIFAAGFIATATLVSGGLSGASLIGIPVARLAAEPIAEILELCLSVIGGSIAAAVYGRNNNKSLS